MINFRFFKKNKKKEEINLPPLPPPPINKKEIENEIETQNYKNEFPIIQEIPEIRPIQEKEIKTPQKIEEKKEIIRTTIKPTYISLKDYNTINDNLIIVQSKLSEAQDYIDKIEKIKQEQEKIFTVWLTHLEDIEKKITRVDEMIFKHQKQGIEE